MPAVSDQIPLKPGMDPGIQDRKKRLSNPGIHIHGVLPSHPENKSAGHYRKSFRRRPFGRHGALGNVAVCLHVKNRIWHLHISFTVFDVYQT